MQYTINNAPHNTIELDDLSSFKSLDSIINTTQGRKTIIALPTEFGGKEQRLFLFLLPGKAWNTLNFADTNEHSQRTIEERDRLNRNVTTAEWLQHPNLRKALAAHVLSAPNTDARAKRRHATVGIMDPKQSRYMFFIAPPTYHAEFERLPYPKLKNAKKTLAENGNGEYPLRTENVSASDVFNATQAPKETTKLTETFANTPAKINTQPDIDQALTAIEEHTYTLQADTKEKVVFLTREQIHALLSTITKNVPNNAYTKQAGEDILDSALETSGGSIYLKQNSDHPNWILITQATLSAIIEDAILVAHKKQPSWLSSPQKVKEKIEKSLFSEKSYISAEEAENLLSSLENSELAVYRDTDETTQNILIMPNGLKSVFENLIAGENPNKALEKKAAPIVEKLQDKAADVLPLYKQTSSADNPLAFFELDMRTFRMMCKSAKDLSIAQTQQLPSSELTL